VKEYFASHQDQLKAVVFGTINPLPWPARESTGRTSSPGTAVMFGSEKYAREYNYRLFLPG